MEDTGLAIVGGSAAGLAAAIAAARRGVDVTLLEAKKEIGVPPSPAIVGLDALWPAEIDRPAFTTHRRLAGSKVRASDGRGLFVDSPLTLFDRGRFDAYLADEARKAGAHIITGVKDLDAQPDRSLVAEDLALKPEVLLFADGARTQATRFLRTTQDPNAMQWGAVLAFDAPEPTENDRLYMTLGAHVPGGRSQLTPLGNGRWVHWTFFRGDPSHGERLARRALELDARLMGWTDELDAQFQGVGPDPLYTLPGTFTGDGVMVAGGAAGQGGLEVGLASGWMAGDIAARALSEGASLDEYERAWRQKYKGFFEKLRGTNDMFIRLTDDEVREFMAAWDGRHLGGGAKLLAQLRNPRGVLAFLRAKRRARSRPAPTVTAEEAPEKEAVTKNA